MSAVPKKKLCWNCEGNVAREMDNCPYCGVYLHATETDEEDPVWKASYRSSQNPKSSEEIPLPLYKVPSVEEKETVNGIDSNADISATLSLFAQFKKDILSILLMMAGSVFLLFGTVLLLFSDQGKLTLQWNGDYWVFFLALAFPFLFFGWRFLHQIEPNEK